MSVLHSSAIDGLVDRRKSIDKSIIEDIFESGQIGSGIYSGGASFALCVGLSSSAKQSDSWTEVCSVVEFARQTIEDQLRFTAVCLRVCGSRLSDCLASRDQQAGMRQRCRSNSAMTGVEQCLRLIGVFFELRSAMRALGDVLTDLSHSFCVQFALFERRRVLNDVRAADRAKLVFAVTSFRLVIGDG